MIFIIPMQKCDIQKCIYEIWCLPKVFKYMLQMLMNVASIVNYGWTHSVHAVKQYVYVLLLKLGPKSFILWVKLRVYCCTNCMGSGKTVFKWILEWLSTS